MVICTNIMLTAINNATNASIKRSLGQKSSKAITVYFSVHANLKVVWNFLENPSVLVALPVPNTDITIQYMLLIREEIFSSIMYSSKLFQTGRH